MSKKVECHEDFFFLIIKIKRTRRDDSIDSIIKINVNEDEENLNEEINLKNDKRYDSIDLDEVD